MSDGMEIGAALDAIEGLTAPEAVRELGVRWLGTAFVLGFGLLALCSLYLAHSCGVIHHVVAAAFAEQGLYVGIRLSPDALARAMPGF